MAYGMTRTKTHPCSTASFTQTIYFGVEISISNLTPNTLSQATLTLALIRLTAVVTQKSFTTAASLLTQADTQHCVTIAATCYDSWLSLVRLGARATRPTAAATAVLQDVARTDDDIDLYDNNLRRT